MRTAVSPYLKMKKLSTGKCISDGVFLKSAKNVPDESLKFLNRNFSDNQQSADKNPKGSFKNVNERFFI